MEKLLVFADYSAEGLSLLQEHSAGKVVACRYNTAHAKADPAKYEADLRAACDAVIRQVLGSATLVFGDPL